MWPHETKNATEIKLTVHWSKKVLVAFRQFQRSGVKCESYVWNYKNTVIFWLNKKISLNQFFNSKINFNLQTQNLGQTGGREFKSMVVPTFSAVIMS